MRILFYSNECNFCLKLLDYINKNNIKKYFKFFNIDLNTNIPDNITVVPTIIDSEIETLFEGNLAFEYIINQKYFNNPTNNIDYWLKTNIPKPLIEEDKKAIDKHYFNFSVFDTENNDTQNNDTQITQQNTPIIIKDKKTLALLKLRKK